jgi:hypothetical protein
MMEANHGIHKRFSVEIHLITINHSQKKIGLEFGLEQQSRSRSFGQVIKEMKEIKEGQ